MSILDRLFAKKAKEPEAETKAPLSETKAPLSETKVPLSDTNVSLSEAKAPLSETKVPLAETNVPLADKQDDPAEYDISKPVENPRLKELFARWNASKSEANLNALLGEIAIKAKFLAVFESPEEIKDNGNDTAVLEKGTTMRFPMILNDEGRVFQPVFGDWSELGKWQGLKQPTKSLIVSFDDLCAMWEKQEKIAGIVINPFGESFTMPREVMTSLRFRKDLNLKGVTELTMKKETKVMFGEPKVYPAEMVRAIAEHLGKSNEVSRAWLRLMMKEGEESYLLVVDFKGDLGTVFGGIAGAARPFLNGMYIDMVPFEDGFGQRAVEGVKPFFVRRG